MGASTSLSKHDLEMIEISWSFVKDKEVIGLNTMIKIFDSSTEIKNVLVFVSGFDLLADIMKNTMARYHSNKVISIVDKIINLLTKSSSSLSEKDINQLVKLGERHYHFGIKTDHFKVNSTININIKNLLLILIIFIFD
jgi:hypothetical protein